MLVIIGVVIWAWCFWFIIKSARKDAVRQRHLRRDSEELKLWKVWHAELANKAKPYSDVEAFAMDYLSELDSMRNEMAIQREAVDKKAKR